LDKSERLRLVLRNVEETVTKSEIERLLEENPHPRAYWGFECSGLMHIGMGLVCGSKIKDMVKAGFEFIIYLADWHSWINNKLGGDMEKIRICGEYFKECFTALGVDPSKVKYVWASDLVGDEGYWEKVIKIAKSVSLQRVWRALPIMGREMNPSDIEAAWIYYPCMQSADIFHMELDVACAGMDQRKAHMLARDVAEKLGWRKPSCIHTHLLLGLQGPSKSEKRFDEDAKLNVQISSKMSKSLPENCIFVHDSPEDIERKIRNAYCPPRQVEGNPILEIAKYIIFAEEGKLTVDRPEKYGGKISFNSFSELETVYLKGDLHPLDLKLAVAKSITEILKPVREHFSKHPERLEEMMKIEVTR